MHPETEEATPHNVLGGLLNSNVWKSREKQEEHGELVPIIYDVVRYRGKDMKDAPYSEKIKALVHVNNTLPDTFQLPKIALNREDKEKMLEDIKQGKLPETKEGVVLWHLHESKPALKAKFIDEHDVYIRGFFPGKGRLTDKGVGGFVYSHELDGPIVGEVGTGFDDRLRGDMHSNPHKYIGMVVTVGSQHKYDRTKALRAPAFLNFHLDKNEQGRLDEISL
jgi:ATP-dependent DNA ligase